MRVRRNKGVSIFARHKTFQWASRDHPGGFSSNECKKHTQEAAPRGHAHAYHSALSSILFSWIFIGFSVWERSRQLQREIIEVVSHRCRD